eukprot:m.4992 g.4992  ORF g.4992 m.4992 type:complete len:163 (+) comp4423_c0_seq1:116-604(+)
MGVILVETPAYYSRGLKFTLATPFLVLLLGLALMIYPQREYTPIYIFSGVLLLLALLYFAILPRKFQVRTDGITLHLGRQVFLPADSIAAVTRAPSDFHYGSIYLATSVSHCVLIQRHAGRGLLISPQDVSGFLNATEDILLGPRMHRSSSSEVNEESFLLV